MQNWIIFEKQKLTDDVCFTFSWNASVCQESYFELSCCFTTKCSFRTLKNYKNRRYCTQRSRGKEEENQGCFFFSCQILQLTGSVCAEFLCAASRLPPLDHIKVVLEMYSGMATSSGDIRWRKKSKANWVKNTTKCQNIHYFKDNNKCIYFSHRID